MRRVSFTVLDTKEDRLYVDWIGLTREDAEATAYEMNLQACPVVDIGDGYTEYVDPVPERYKAVKLILEDLE